MTIKIDVCCPIKAAFRLKFKDVCFSVEFSYERLPFVWFICGYFGQTKKFIPILLNIESRKALHKLSPSLRALSRCSQQNVGDRWLRSEAVHGDPS